MITSTDAIHFDNKYYKLIFTNIKNRYKKNDKRYRKRKQEKLYSREWLTLMTPFITFWGNTKKLDFGLQKEILEHTVNVTVLF